jgi:hypothetical protein
MIINLQDIPNEQEKRKVNRELDHSINELVRLKNKFKPEPEHYFIDPTIGDVSNHVDYNRDMYTIDLGQPTCGTQNCVTTGEMDAFRINPNIKDNWRPSEEQYTLNPKSNQLVSKWELDQKSQLKIYPHMYAPNTELANLAKKTWKGGIERGGTDFPIPMRFQLRYLQQPPHKDSHNIDYDVHIRSQSDNRPDEHNKILNPTQFGLKKPAGNERCNLQRGIVDRNLANKRLDRMFDKVHRNEITMRDELRRAARSVGVFEKPKHWVENQQCENHNRQKEALRRQPLYEHRYKGVQQIGETCGPNVRAKSTTKVTAAKGPTPQAQKSSFFGLGPPLPPPNPELLSAVDSDMLGRRSPTGNQQLDSIIAQRDATVPYSAIERHRGIESPTASENRITLPTDLSWTIKTGSTLGDLAEGFDGGVRGEQQFLPHPGGETDFVASIKAKQSALRRIEYQQSHLKRLLPFVRKKQVHSKDTSHTVEIVNSTNKIAQIEKTIFQLELLHKLVNEEIDAMASKLPSGTKIPTVAGHKLEQHYFNNIPLGVGSFYTEPDFQGKRVELGHGFFDFPRVGGVENNALRSFKVPRNTVLYLYTKPRRQGVRLKYTGPMRVRKLPSRYRRQISGIELKEVIPPYAATCYSGPVYQGDIVSLKIGFYDYPQVGGIGNRKLASFKLPDELLMTVYSRPGKTGDKLTYIGPINLAHLPGKWTNKVSGIEIQLKKK